MPQPIYTLIKAYIEFDVIVKLWLTIFIYIVNEGARVPVSGKIINKSNWNEFAIEKKTWKL